MRHAFLALILCPPILALSSTAGLHAAPCRHVSVEGQVSAGTTWQTSIGQGWVFRLQPIQPASYSGWDMVVDRQPGAGYPDALLLATPPYGSLNEREIGTTFHLRAQDALGWNPRVFRFLTDRSAFREARQLLPALLRPSGSSSGAARRLLELQHQAASGELRILDARLTPGTADPAPYAENWARAFTRTAYTLEPAPAGRATPLGSIASMRFSLELTLPPDWQVPPGLHATSATCAP